MAKKTRKPNFAKLLSAIESAEPVGGSPVFGLPGGERQLEELREMYPGHHEAVELSNKYRAQRDALLAAAKELSEALDMCQSNEYLYHVKIRTAWDELDAIVKGVEDGDK